MRLKNYLLTESFESKRLNYDLEDHKIRLFVKSYLKDSEKTWIDSIGDVLAVEATIDLDPKEKNIYLNRIDAFKKGKGYGRETIDFILSYLKRKGYKTARGYVEYLSIESANMLKKLNFKEVNGGEFGRYFEKRL